MADIGSINMVILLGYLGKDPELQKDLNSGAYFCVLDVATKERFKPKEEGGKPVYLTTWHRCVAWRTAAEIITKYGRKGTLVSIIGKNKRKVWETKDGEHRQRVEVSVDSITIVGGKLKHPVDDPPEEEEASPDKEKEKKGDDPY